jgi:phosphoenolpyruvate-protein kinase (PTS system EI component)
MADRPEGFRVLANVNLFRDARQASLSGADGIGLYRSEFPFIIRNDLLTEEEQYVIYRRIAETVPSGEIVFRTADIGGDKILAARGEDERNPFLGVRGIRFSLANRHMFQDQLRAMLRAGAGHDLRIMFPMVSSVEEYEEALSEVDASIASLKRDGFSFNSAPKLGAMIELPSAVESISELADLTDFLSIGTNDLVMYLLAVDRTNERLSQLYRSYHPTVLRVIKRIAEGVGPKLSELSVCGDAASDPRMVRFFLGLGIRKVSVAPADLHAVSRAMSMAAGDSSLGDFANEMLSIRTVREMEQFFADGSPA